MKLLILAMFLAVMQPLPPVPRKVATPPAQGGGDSKNQSQSNEKTADPSLPLIKIPEQPISADIHDTQVASQNEEQSVHVVKLPPIAIVKDKKSFWDQVFDWGPWIFSFFLVGVGAWQVWLLFRTLGAIRRQADIMKDQMEISVSKERPRITIEPGTLNMGSSRPNAVKYTIDYWCPTPASIVDARAEAYIGSIIPKIPSFPMVIPNRVNETAKLEEFHPILDAISPETISQINAGNQSVFFCGFIEYRGIHLSNNEPSYRTSFRYKWVVINILGPYGYWEKCGRPEDNQET